MTDKELKIMKTLRVTSNNIDCIVSYELDEISSIEYGQMKDFYSYSDILGNGYKPDDNCIKISFKDTAIATFGKDWIITFE
ncbi:MAG: hypothetical protein PHT76_12480 [Anaerostipes sp.]|nr:hypothetical protein [Anaerostipes sp.]